MTREPTGNLFAKGAEVPQEDQQGTLWFLQQESRSEIQVSVSRGHCPSGQPVDQCPRLRAGDKNQRACNYFFKK